jgi:hypothetical protein
MGIPMSQSEKERFHPSQKIRLLSLVPLVVACAIFWAPVGIITVLKIQSFDMVVPYWLLFVGLCIAACFVRKKTSFWAIFAFLAGFTVLNAVGGLRFFGAMKGMH